jgi:hypothetical protein
VYVKRKALAALLLPALILSWAVGARDKTASQDSGLTCDAVLDEAKHVGLKLPPFEEKERLRPTQLKMIRSCIKRENAALIVVRASPHR